MTTVPSRRLAAGPAAPARLRLLGAMLLLGWDKAGGPAAELAWWERHALAAAALL